MKLFKVGMITSVCYFLILVGAAWLLNLGKMNSLNEFGDFLAGAFSPVAFLWLVLGFLQQQSELQQNTQALKLQADELRNSVEQYKEMVAIARDQLTSDIERVQHDKLVRENETKPVIKLHSLRFQSKTGGAYTFKTSVTSEDREARNLSIDFTNGFGRYKSFMQDVVKKSFSLPENIIPTGELPDEVVVIICYESIIGKKYKHRYRYYNLLEGVYQNFEHQELVV